jgi:hypothetical protein
MNRLRIPIVIVALLAASGPAPLSAQDAGVSKAQASRPPIPIGASRSIWYFDGRDDDRDFPTNGFFPGDFAANPSGAAIGAAGIFGSNPAHAANGYPGILGAQPDQSWCVRRYRSYDRTSGTFLGNDGARHRCW